MRVRVFLFLVLALTIALTINAGSLSAEESYAIAMHGAPALPADFSHMPYANPDAPKGGRLVQGFLGTFDSLNPLIVRGLAVLVGARQEEHLFAALAVVASHHVGGDRREGHRR